MWIVEQAKKHQPGVEIQNDKIIIKIWKEIPHPMTKEHLIDQIVILKLTPAGWTKIEEFNLSYENQPQIEITKEKLWSWQFKVQARCNIHWTWEEEFTI